MANWSFGALGRAFTYTMQIGSEFINAKSAASAGGNDIVQSEMIDITAKTAAAWAREDGLPLEIEIAELVRGYEDAGWKIIYESENEGVNNG